MHDALKHELFKQKKSFIAVYESTYKGLTSYTVFTPQEGRVWARGCMRFWKPTAGTAPICGRASWATNKLPGLNLKVHYVSTMRRFLSWLLHFAFEQPIYHDNQFTSFNMSSYLSSLSEVEQVLCRCGAFIYLGMERFMANMPPAKLAALNLSGTVHILTPGTVAQTERNAC